MYLTQKERASVTIKKSRNGQGIFAKKDFKAGQIIFQVTGPLVTCDEDEAMDETERANTFRYSAKWFISPKGRLGDMLNHSCAPNARVVKKAGRLLITAFSRIQKGDEISIDYSTILAGDDTWTMRCDCGEPACRRTIGQFRKLPRRIRERYLANDMVPPYILVPR